MTRTAPPRLANFRDLGGLPTDDGRTTRYGVLYRSDAPHPGDVPPDAAPWPPALVVDLRCADEGPRPHPLAGAGVEVLDRPLLDDARPPAPGDPHGALADIYRRILDRAAALLPAVLDTVTAAPGPVLVHCAAGKDRTGVLVALLLRTAGVTREAVVADYCATDTNMGDVRRRLYGVTEPVAGFADLMRAPAAAVGAVLDRIGPDWLPAHGVTPAVSARWRDRLVGRGQAGSPSTTVRKSSCSRLTCPATRDDSGNGSS